MCLGHQTKLLYLSAQRVLQGASSPWPQLRLTTHFCLSAYLPLLHFSYSLLRNVTHSYCEMKTWLTKLNTKDPLATIQSDSATTVCFLLTPCLCVFSSNVLFVHVSFPFMQYEIYAVTTVKCIIPSCLHSRCSWGITQQVAFFFSSIMSYLKKKISFILLDRVKRRAGGERVRERESFCPLVHSPDGCKCPSPWSSFMAFTSGLTGRWIRSGAVGTWTDSCIGCQHHPPARVLLLLKFSLLQK